MLPKGLSVQDGRLMLYFKHAKTLREKLEKNIYAFIEKISILETEGKLSEKDKKEIALLMETIDLAGAALKGAYKTIEEEMLNCNQDINQIMQILYTVNANAQAGRKFSELASTVVGKEKFNEIKEEVSEEENQPISNIFLFKKKKDDEPN
jgi:hypothetical protein